MHCSNARQRLDQAYASGTRTLDAEVLAHLQTCESCRDYNAELRLDRLLATDPVPPMRTGFADQALARAWEQGHPPTAQPAQPPRFVTWAGMAASLLLGVLVINHWLVNSPVDVPSANSVSANAVASQGAQVGANTPAAIARVEVAPAVTRHVQVRLVSKDVLPDATITIRTEGDVALTGYPENQPLRWTTAIAAGNNQMSVPINLKTGSTGSKGGTVVIRVQAGDASKEMRFDVQPEAAVATLAFPVYLASI